MSVAGGVRDHDWFAKRWYEEFSENRNFGDEDRPWIEQRRSQYDPEYNDVQIIMRDHDDDGDENSELVESFCWDAQLKDLDACAGVARNRRAAFVDDRSAGEESDTLERVREYDQPLTAAGLYDCLKEKRRNHDCLNDVERRLIYIQDLDPYYILALGHTAPALQIRALREGFGRHLSFEPSINVKIPARGFLFFQLGLHLPQYVLRELSSDQIEPTQNLHARPGADVLDLAFLNSDIRNAQDHKSFQIVKACFSLIICGIDHQRWNGYGFGYNDFGVSLEVKKPEEDGPMEDPIPGPIQADQNIPVLGPLTSNLDPREYFLLVLRSRIVLFQRKWKKLSQFLRSEIDNYIERNPLGLFQRLPQPRVDPESDFKWTQTALHLLGQLLEKLSETIKTWEDFKSNDGGDIAYFNSLHLEIEKRGDWRAQSLLRSIREEFLELERIQRALISLREKCKERADALKHQTALQNNQAAQHSGILSEITNAITAPIGLAATFFSMQPTVIPVPQNFRSFIIATVVLIFAMRILYVMLAWLLQTGTRGWWRQHILAWLDVTRLGRLFDIGLPTQGTGLLERLKRLKQTPNNNAQRIGTENDPAV